MFFAFIFDSIGGTEWLVLLGVVLVVVGPKNLPSAARKLGSIMAKLRRAADEFKRQIMTMDEEFRKGVENAVNVDDTSSTDGSSSSSASASGGDSSTSSQADDGGDRAETDYYGGEYDENNPYPGHEYYDETQYQDETYKGDAVGDESAASDATSSTSVEEPAKPKSDPYAIKITVSTSARKGKTA